MGRLIDEDALRWAIRNNAPKSVPLWIYQTIDNAPTAYNPEKVVEQLEDRGTLSRPVGWSKSYEIITLKDAVEIVKGGGADG